MIEQLFGSKTRVKLLRLFYSNPNRSFYVREITRKIDEQINSVRRELSNLLSIGIIASEDTNNRLYYEVNQQYEYYKPLAEIFGGAAMVVKDTPEHKEEVLVSAPSIDPVADEFKSLGNVDLVVYTGQFTRDEASGIDLLIVGDINHTRMTKFMTDLEAQESKELRYAVMTPDEFSYRRQMKDRFISTVLSSKKQVLVDKNHTL